MEATTTIVYVQSRCKGNKVRHPTEEAARKRLEQIQVRELAEGKVRLGRVLQTHWCDEHQSWHVGGKRVAVPLAALREEFLADYIRDGRRTKQWFAYRRAFDLLELTGLETAGGITEAFIPKFLETVSEGRSPITVKGYLGALRAVSNHCLRKGYLKRSPFKEKPVKKWIKAKPIRKIRHYSREEIGRVLRLMQADVDHTTGWKQWKARRLLALTATVAYCGLRAGEAQHLMIEDIDLDHRAINIVSRDEHGLKTDDAAQPVAMPAALVPILERWFVHRMDAPPGFVMDPACKWLFPTTRRRAPWISGHTTTKPIYCLQTVAKRAGVEGMTFLSLRHSWSTHAEYFNVPGALIQRNLRHTSEKTSQLWYRHPDLVNLRQAVEGFVY